MADDYLPVGISLLSEEELIEAARHAIAAYAGRSRNCWGMA
jgi:hypothetical protein